MLILFLLHILLIIISFILNCFGQKDKSSFLLGFDDFSFMFIPFLGLFFCFLFLIQYPFAKKSKLHVVDSSFKTKIPKMTFDDFEKYFFIAPEKWEKADYNDCHCMAYSITDKNHRYLEKKYIMFSSKDIKRVYSLYDEYYENKKAYENCQLQNETLTLILEDIQKDVQILNEKSKKEIDKANETARQVANNLKKEIPNKLKLSGSYFSDGVPISVFKK